MTDSKSKKNVLVTGAASGIGRAVAEKYFREGYDVIGLDRIQKDMDFPVISCNVADEVSVAQTFEILSEKINSINYLINCAGVFFVNSREKIEDISLNEWNAVYKNNATSVMLITKYSLPFMKSSQGDKAIVNISSDQVKYPRSKNTSYATSKSAIECFSKACAAELLREKIRVNVVRAASVKTGFIKKLAGDVSKECRIYNKENSKMPFGLIYPEDVAELVFFLGSDKSIRLTGQAILIDSGLYV